MFVSYSVTNIERIGDFRVTGLTVTSADASLAG
jgi:hypothetical protein